MKTIVQKWLSMLLAMVLMFAGTEPILQTALPASAAITMSVKQIEAFKPEFTEVKQILAEHSDSKSRVDFLLTPKNLPGDLSDWTVDVEIASAADGNYKWIDAEFEAGKLHTWFDRRDVYRYGNTYYLRIRYGTVKMIDARYRYTQYSEPIKLPAMKPWQPSVSGERVSSTKLFVNLSNWYDTWEYDASKWEAIFIRQLQIREVGTSKWAYVSKSKAVKALKLTKSGYLLTVGKNKEYEFRARYYTVIDGKKYYSQYSYSNSKDFTVTAQPQNLSVMQFDAADKDGIVLYWDADATDTTEYYQLAYRKAGSKDAWKTVKLQEKDLLKYNNGITQQPATAFRVKLGYEYRIRACRKIAGVTSVSKYSNKVTVTKKSVKFVSKADDALFEYWIGRSNGNQPSDRPVYDPNKSVFDNYLALEDFASGSWSRFIRTIDYYDSNGKKRVGEIIMGNDHASVIYGYGYGGRVNMVKGEEGIVAVEVYASVDVRGGGAAIVEILRFFSGDAEMANAFYRWRLAATTFGHANTDYFGFKDVKITDNEWILEYNGREYRITKGKKGYIFCFDMNG